MGNYTGELKKGIRITFPNTDFTDIDFVEFVIRKPQTKTVDTFLATIEDVSNKKVVYVPVTDYYDEYGLYVVHPAFTYTDLAYLKGDPVQFLVNDEFMRA